MTTALPTLLLVLFATVASLGQTGQNLIINGDFETYSSCPTFQDQINLATGWFAPAIQSSDYFNQCGSSAAGVNVPNTGLGFQQSHSGAAFGGLYCFISTNNYREYISTSLDSALTQNRCYHFEMYVSICADCGYTTDAIGVYFSDSLVLDSISLSSPLPFTPQVENTSGYITPAMDWALVSGDYIAHGGEKYLLIGNFKNDTSTSRLLIGDSNNPYVYFYIDDVSLTRSDCVGIDQPNNNIIPQVYPNPFANNLFVSGCGQNETELIIYNTSMCKISCQTFFDNVAINTSQFEHGLYFYELRNKNGLVKLGRLLK